ncbi:MAG: hypothetical protein KBS89_00855 [Bacteroidales bacterium]|nr:hypothetical protein [Candidatus Egerieousia equi]
MNNDLTLKSVFAKGKDRLDDSLKGLSLPKDSIKVQSILTDYLSALFDNENGYRQNLTESEDYIFQAVIRLLNSQQNIAKEIAKFAKPIVTQDAKVKKQSKATNPYVTIAGAGVGAIVGGIIGSWAAVAGAIAGTALVLYFSAKPVSKTTTISTDAQTKLHESTIDVTVFSNIVESICESIDGVIDTFRTQIKRVANVYEQREKPTLTSDYSTLLEQIANVYNVCSTTEGVPAKVKNAVDMLAESLENYNLKIVNGKIINE